MQNCRVLSFSRIVVVGPGNLWSGPRSIRAQGPCRGGCVSRMNDERSRCQGEQLRTTLSSALQDFKGKSNVSMKAIPKQPPEGDASRMGPTWRYGAKLVQGKYVPFALNALASVLTKLNEKRRLDSVTSIIVTNRKQEGTADGTGTEVGTYLTNKWRAKINQEWLYNVKANAPKGGWEKWPKNRASQPASKRKTPTAITI